VFQFYDGISTSAPILWEATGLRYPEVVVSTQLSMTIAFLSDKNGNAAGFHINWSAVLCEYTSFYIRVLRIKKQNKVSKTHTIVVYFQSFL